VIDVASLKKDLMDYYGTAKELNPVAMLDLIEVEKGDINTLKEKAIEAGIDLENYVLTFDGD